MLQGHPPFEAQSPVQILIMHQTQQLPPLDKLRFPLPKAVWEVLEGLCRKDPDDRPQMASAVVKELDRILKVLAKVQKPRREEPG